MSAPRSGDEDLVGQLPLPLALLYRRARNAKTARDQVQTAGYLAEATLKLAAALRIGVARTAGLPPESPLARSLDQVLIAGLAPWAGMLRSATEYLRLRPDAALLPLADAHEPLLRSAPLPAVTALAERLVAGPPPGVLGFFDLLAAHASVFSTTGPTEELGPLLFTAIDEVLRQPCLFGELTLAAARAVPNASGRTAPLEWQGLRGPASLLLTPDAVGAEPVRTETEAREGAGRVFFVGRGVRAPLHPLVVYYEDRQEREWVGFLHCPTGSGPRCEYLDYVSGDRLRDLDAPGEAARWLEQVRGEPVGEAEGSRPEEAPDAAVVGDFELGEELGGGAMGVVYRARQRSLNRWVALKVLRPALAADPPALARFHREAAALARCEHPHLVKVLTSGRDGDRCYFAMELVEGADLARLADVLRAWKERGPLRESHVEAAVLATRDRRAVDPPPSAAGRAFYYRLAELFADAAEAVAHLHGRGILHRDLKPGNFLLTRDGRLVVMDLGVAQFRDPSQALTSTGTRWVGTLRYCAPEQLQWKLRGVDERADVYALGATLYELTVLSPVFDGATDVRLIEQVLHQAPRPPRRLDPAFPRDLADILAACLAKDRTRRYASARDLADDLRRFRDGRPVRIRPATPLRRLSRWVRRSPLLAGLAAAVVLLLAAVVLGSLAFAAKSGSDKNQIEAQAAQLRQAVEGQRVAAEQAQASAGEAEQRLAEAERRHRDQEKAQEEAADRAREEARARLDRALTVNRVVRAEREWLADDVGRADELLDECPVGLRGWEWGYVRRLCHADLRTLRGHTADVWGVAFSPDGTRLASAGGRGDYGEVLLWDADGAVRPVQGAFSDRVERVAFSPDGRTLASAGNDKRVRLWNVATGDETTPLAWGYHDQPVVGLSFSPDGKKLATVSLDPAADAEEAAKTAAATVWAVSGGEKLFDISLRNAVPLCAVFRPDGERIGVGCADHTIRFVDADAGKEQGQPVPRAGAVVWLAYSRDGRRLASASAGDRAEVRVWDAEAERELAVVPLHGGGLPALSADGTRLAAVSADGRAATVWDADTGDERATERGHTDTILALALSADGRRLATTGADRTVKLWDVTRRPEVRILKPDDGQFSSLDVAFSGDGRRLAVAAEKTVTVWDAVEDRATTTFKGHHDPVRAVVLGPDGRLAASAAGDSEHPEGKLAREWGEVKVWYTANGAEAATLPDARAPLAFRADGKSLIGTAADGTVRIWEAATGHEERRLQATHCLAIRPDGRRLAVAVSDGVAVWDADADHELCRLSGVKAGNGRDLVFSADGRRVAGWSAGKVTVWDAADGRLLAALQGRSEDVHGLALSADGRRLVTVRQPSEKASEVKVWDADTGEEAFTLRGHSDDLDCVAFSPDGRRVAAAGGHEVAVWEAQSGPDSITLRAHGDSIQSVAFGPADAPVLVSADQGGRVKTWDPSSGKETRSWDAGGAGRLNLAVLRPDGRRVALAFDEAVLEVRDAADGAIAFRLTDLPSPAAAVAFSPDGKRIAVGVNPPDGTSEVRMIDASTGKETGTFAVAEAEVRAVAFSPDGKYLAAGGGGQADEKAPERTWGMIEVWDLSTGKTVYTLKGSVNFQTMVANEDRGHALPVNAVAFSLDGKRLVSASMDGHVKVWEAASGKPVRSLRRELGGVQAVAISPDGRCIAFGGRDGVVRVCDAATGRDLASLQGHTEEVLSVTFSADGKALASAGRDETVRVWDESSWSASPR